jgi:hypothetical protein
VENTAARTLCDMLGMVYKVHMIFNVCQIKKELLGIRIKDNDNGDTYAVRINEMVQE